MNSEKIRIVLEGALGEWSQKKYYKSLLNAFLESMIDLITVDTKFSPLSDGVPFINKADQKKVYHSLTDVDIIIITSEPDTHIDIALEWINKLKTPTTILIEKPLDTNLEKIHSFYATIKDTPWERHVYLIDHYYLKCYSSLTGLLKSLKKKILNSSSFVTETNSISPIQIENLKAGVISDLLTHALLPIAKSIALTENKSINEVILDLKIVQSKIASYKNSLISNETFAQIDLMYPDLPIQLFLGKGIDTKEHKYTIITFTDHSYVKTHFKDNSIVYNSITEPIVSEPIAMLLELIIHRKNQWSLIKEMLIPMRLALLLANLTFTIKDSSKLLPSYDEKQPIEEIALCWKGVINKDYP